MHAPSLMLLKLSTTRWALGFSALLGLILCALPLVAVLGPESALVLSLVLTPWCCVLGARLAIAARSQSTRTSNLIAEALGGSWLLLALPFLLLCLNGFRVQSCEPLRGLAFIALGPWASVSFAAVVGVLLGAAIRSPRRASILAGLFPLLSIARPLYDFVTTPGIFAYGHFFGYFPGTFYDRLVDVPQAWLSHRGLTLLLGMGLWAVLSASRSPKTGRLQLARARKHPLLCLGAVLTAAASVSMARAGNELHHHTSRAFVEHKLGRAIETQHCRVVVPRELPLAEATRIAEDCAFRLTTLEKELGVKERETVTAYFFRSPQEKRSLMGAMRVYIAKPWRREVYLQLGGYPHPVLPHELAHIVARHSASGMFGVPGKLWGLIPEPTLVEGMAVALEPVARDELTPHQWAKAAQKAGLAPALAQLLGPRFFSHNQHLSYTLSGSFLRFVLETRGAEALRRVYREGDVERALAAPFSSLEQSWHAYLEQIPLPEPAAALAKQRFERAGVFSQVCPHAIERLEGDIASALASGDLPRAIEKCGEVLAIDGRNTGIRATLVGALARAGQLDTAEQELGALKQPPEAPKPTQARAETGLADAAYLEGDFARAEQIYRRLLLAPQSEGELRQLEVKLLGLEAGEPTRALLGDLLIGRLGGRSDNRAAMHLISQLYPLRKDGLAWYLEARQLLNADRPDLAHPLIRKARSAGLPTRRLRMEALRMHGQSAFLTGSLNEAEACYREMARLIDASQAEILDARDALARIAFRRMLSP